MIILLPRLVHLWLSGWYHSTQARTTSGLCACRFLWQNISSRFFLTPRCSMHISGPFSEGCPDHCIQKKYTCTIALTLHLLLFLHNSYNFQTLFICQYPHHQECKIFKSRDLVNCFAHCCIPRIVSGTKQCSVISKQIYQLY